MTKTKIINIRATAEDRDRIDYAASVLGKTRTVFMLEAATALALRILAAAAREAKMGKSQTTYRPPWFDHDPMHPGKRPPPTERPKMTECDHREKIWCAICGWSAQPQTANLYSILMDLRGWVADTRDSDGKISADALDDYLATFTDEMENGASAITGTYSDGSVEFIEIDRL